MGCQWGAVLGLLLSWPELTLQPLSSNYGPATVSPFEEEEQVQGTVATCRVSPPQGKTGVKSREQGRSEAQACR